LFALAISNAPALQGFTKMLLGDGCAGEPGWVETEAPSVVARREGERRGEEKERR